MADKSQALIVEALERVLAEPGGMPLFAARSQPGIFAGNVAGKRAAQFCLTEGYLETVRSERRGKGTVEICTLSEKGQAFLLERDNPRPLLEACIRSVDARHEQIARLLDNLQMSQRHLEDMKKTVQLVVNRVSDTGPPARKNGHAHSDVNGGLDTLILDRLGRWQAGTDCPLPELYRSIHAGRPSCTIGQFHDCLRQLSQESRIYLHPWTGPLYELPEPNLALLAGHEVAYYASPRKMV